MSQTHIKLCTGKHCSRQYPSLHAAATKKVFALHAEATIVIDRCGCLGQCEKGPNILIEQHGKNEIQTGMTPFKIGDKIEQLAGKKPIIVSGQAKKSLNDLLKGGF